MNSATVKLLAVIMFMVSMMLTLTLCMKTQRQESMPDPEYPEKLNMNKGKTINLDEIEEWIINRRSDESRRRKV